MVDWSISLADNHPLEAFGTAMRSIIAPNRTWFPYLVILGEASVGIGLTLGNLTPVSALAGIFMNLNYLLLAGVRPCDRS